METYPHHSANLRNADTYPPLSHLPPRYVFNMSALWALIGRPILPVPRRHWCFLATIVNVKPWESRLVLELKDMEQNTVPLIFSVNVPGRGNIFRDKCKVGHTVAVTYPMTDIFPDFRDGIIVDEKSEFKVLPFSLEKLLEVNDTVFSLPTHEEVESCNHCSRKCPKLFRCSKCTTVYYCGKGCQSNAWIKGHKAECSAMKELRWFLEKDWTQVVNRGWYHFDS
ncbi:hypothetical protein RUND412_001880 [Rhizina undulata]